MTLADVETMMLADVEIINRLPCRRDHPIVCHVVEIIDRLPWIVCHAEIARRMPLRSTAAGAGASSPASPVGTHRSDGVQQHCRRALATMRPTSPNGATPALQLVARCQLAGQLTIAAATPLAILSRAAIIPGRTDVSIGEKRRAAFAAIEREHRLDFSPQIAIG
jgi:hypothetical protein